MIKSGLTTKKSFFALSLLALSVFVINLVSAFGPNLKDLINSSGSGFWSNLVGFIFGASITTDIFTLLLMFVLAALVIFGLLESVNLFEGDTLKGWIAVIVALIGIRFLPSNFLSLLATPSSALVAIIVGGLPMLILFQVTKKAQFKPYARTIWGVYAFICIFLGVYNLGTTYAGSPQINFFGWQMSVVAVTFWVLGIASIIFAIFWKYFMKAEAKINDTKVEDVALTDSINEIDVKIDTQTKYAEMAREAGNIADADNAEIKILRLKEQKRKLLARK